MSPCEQNVFDGLYEKIAKEVKCSGRYLQPPRALWVSAARDVQRPRRPVRQLLGNCCCASPTCGGSAWPPRALLPDPGPAEPGGPSAAGFRTGRKEGQIQSSTDKDDSLSDRFNKMKTLRNAHSTSVKHSVQPHCLAYTVQRAVSSVSV